GVEEAVADLELVACEAPRDHPLHEHGREALEDDEQRDRRDDPHVAARCDLAHEGQHDGVPLDHRREREGQQAQGEDVEEREARARDHVAGEELARAPRQERQQPAQRAPDELHSASPAQRATRPATRSPTRSMLACSSVQAARRALRAASSSGSLSSGASSSATMASATASGSCPTAIPSPPSSTTCAAVASGPAKITGTPLALAAKSLVGRAKS